MGAALSSVTCGTVDVAPRGAVPHLPPARLRRAAAPGCAEASAGEPLELCERHRDEYLGRPPAQYEPTPARRGAGGGRDSKKRR